MREMASLLEPISNTKVHDHSSRRRSSLKDVSTDAIPYNSYGDIWGESSFRSIADDLKSKVIDEKADLLHEQRWSAEIETLNSATFKVNLDEDLEETNIVSVGAGAGAGIYDYSDPEPSSTVPITAKPKGEGKLKRRGSNDMMPIRPNRRSSSTSTIVGKGELAEITAYEDLSRRVTAGTVNEEDYEEA